MTSTSTKLLKLKCSDRGRPNKKKQIDFTPQPKSIVSQFLSKIKNDKSVLEHLNLIIDETSDSDRQLLKDNRHESFNTEQDCTKNDTICLSNKVAPNDRTSKNIEFPTITTKEVEDNSASSQLSKIICQICSTGSNSSFKHKVHMKTHKIGNKFCCDYPDCTYSSTISSNLIKHKRSHTSDKPYLCDKCSFRTNFINSLKVHKRLHTFEKPFQCQQCDYKCNSSSNLKKHCWHRHLRHNID